MRRSFLLTSSVVGGRGGKTVRTRVNNPRRPLAISSRGRGRDLWIRPNRWRSHHPIRPASPVSVLIHLHVFADRAVNSVAIRFPDFMVSEKELMAAMSSVGPNMAVKVADWTTTIDDRCTPATIGFFVELAGEQGMYSFPRIPHETRFSLDMASQSPISHSHRDVCSTSWRAQMKISPGPSHTMRSANPPSDSSNLGRLAPFGN